MLRTILLIAVLPAVPAAAQVKIALRPRAAVESENVRLGDVAEITGSTSETRSALRQLDIGSFEPDTDSLTIRQSLIAIHLRLAGWPVNRIEFTGASQVVVTPEKPQPLSDIAIEAAAAETMQLTLNLSEDDIRVQLISPFMQTLPSAVQRDKSLTVKVLPPLNARIGTVPLTVQLWRGNRLVHSRTGRFDALRRHQVVVSRTSLPRGHTITEEDVQAELRFLAAPADQLDPSRIIGRQLRTNVPVGSILQLKNLQAPQQPRQEQIIRARDSVQITAVSGRLRVKLTAAEALQSGRLGDTIRVRNLKSSEIISGRITAPGQVEIRL